MTNEIEILDQSDDDFSQKFDFALWSVGSSSDYSNDRNRPYNGQSWTDQGERGKQEVKGLTMRDIADCLIKAMLVSSPGSDQDLFDYVTDAEGRVKLLSEKVSDNTWRYQDVYKIKFENVDPIAIVQNLGCEIEKMMGIFPNIPK